MKKTILLLLVILVTAVCAAEGFEVRYIDVGQGNAALVICDDEVMLIDGGSKGCSSLMYSYLKNTLGIDHMAYVISTHPDADHVGGIAGALNACTVDVIYTPVLSWDTKAFNNMLKYAGAAEIRLPQAPETFMLGSATVQLLGPVNDSSNTNDLSIITRITYGQTVFMFMGDAESQEEADLVGTGWDISADVLCIGHHGSSTSSTCELLSAVEPAYAVISVGKGNSYGHPAATTLDRLGSISACVYRTDECGDIICRSDGIHLYFETEKRA